MQRIRVPRGKQPYFPSDNGVDNKGVTIREEMAMRALGDIISRTDMTVGIKHSVERAVFAADQMLLALYPENGEISE
jgi:hypothetical protein